MDADLNRIKISSKRQQDLHTVVFVNTLTISSDAGGAIAGVVQANPSISLDSTWPDWSSAAAIYDECRCLGMEVTYDPTEMNGNLIFQGPFMTCIDYDSNATPSGYPYVSQYASALTHKGSRPWTRRVLASGVEDLGFVGTNAPITPFIVKWYSGGNTVSRQYGFVTARLFMQFRGKGI
jgi:hypothetical protein